MAAYEGLVLVVGASGGVGQRVVKILAQEGIKTRVLVRDPRKGAALEKLGAEVNLTDLSGPTAATSLKTAMQGVRAVLSALGSRQPFDRRQGLRAVDYEGTRRLVDAARQAGTVEHFVLNSTMGVRQHRNILKPLSFVFYPKWQAEEYLAHSGLTYTIIRPGGLVDDNEALKGPAGWQHKPAFALAPLDGEGGFDSLGRVHRQDVAEAMVKSLWLPATRNRIFDILDRASLKPPARSKILKDVF